MILFCYTEIGDSMKRYIFFILCILFLCVGCGKVEDKVISPTPIEDEEEIEAVEVYQDENYMPISFYTFSGNQIQKKDTHTGNYQKLDDILFYQVFPSIENQVTLHDSFGKSFYDQWISYATEKPVRMGFSLQFSTNTGDIFYNILRPNDAMSHWEYIMGYLYDDYANLGKSFYSHVEDNEFGPTTLFTAIKLQCGDQCANITSPIILTVYTYDDEEDFLDGVYRGNSQATMTICINGNC